MIELLEYAIQCRLVRMSSNSNGLKRLCENEKKYQ
jgi:hypothetical protein